MTNADMLPVAADRQPVVNIIDGEAMADSRDIAAFFDKEHRSVLRTVDDLLSQEPDLALRSFVQGSYKLQATGDQAHRRFLMTRDGFTLLAMGFTGAKALKFKLAYIERFNVMEAELRGRPPVDPMKALNDPTAMRGLLLTYSEKLIEAQGAIEEMRPQVQALDRIAQSEGSFCITDAAKTLQVSPNVLFRYLRGHGWIYNRPGTSGDVAYQPRLASGDLEHKTTTVLRADGTEKTVTQVRVTPKGLTKLAKLLPPIAIAA